MPECLGCNSHVTEDFQLVFGNNENDVYGCPECMDAREIYEGGPARTPHPDKRQVATDGGRE